MGKSNRIKQNKQNAKAMSLNDYSKTKKKDMPNWAVNLISIVVTVAIIMSVAVISLSSTGLVMRMRTAMSSENYRVNGNMMKYYFQTTYQNFTTNYESYMSYLSLDTSKSLKNQVIGDTSVNANAIDTAIVGSEYEGKTWYDYFMDKTQSEVRNMLYYCEEADKRNITLGDEDKKVIDSSIDTIRATADAYGYTVNAYLTNAFGKGISENDVRKAMEISSLSSKVMTVVAEELDGKITSDRIEAKYNENKKIFDLVDYTYYTFRINYSDIESDVKKSNANATDDDILNAYKQAIADTKTMASELGSKTDSNEFEKYYLNYVANDEFDTELDFLDEYLDGYQPPRRVSVATGVAAYPTIKAMAARLTLKMTSSLSGHLMIRATQTKLTRYIQVTALRKEKRSLQVINISTQVFICSAKLSISTPLRHVTYRICSSQAQKRQERLLTC